MDRAHEFYSWGWGFESLSVRHLRRAMKKYTIAVLPTGDWAQVESENDVQIVELTPKQFHYICEHGCTENQMLELAESCTESNIDSILFGG